ncbi:MAG TPA: ArsC family reductase [Povalibacter sp.]|jgi:arsenate reductase|nr:ArsC family reductase [Povalibacter sp.]
MPPDAESPQTNAQPPAEPLNWRTNDATEYQRMTVTLYGIRNCDTMKRARTWLDRHGVSYQFHDYKNAGIGRATLERWVGQVGWEVLLNRAGTTFRKLPPAQREDLDADRAVALMLAQPSMIKRPVIDMPDGLLVGFKPDVYAARFTGA